MNLDKTKKKNLEALDWLRNYLNQSDRWYGFVNVQNVNYVNHIAQKNLKPLECDASFDINLGVGTDMGVGENLKI